MLTYRLKGFAYSLSVLILLITALTTTSVALIEWGAAKDINTIDIKDPIIGFVFNNKGLMYNLTLEGSKFIRINR